MKWAAAIVVLLCAVPLAAAQEAAAPPSRTKPARAADPAARFMLPQQFAPPQEAYASFPESGPATAAAAPAKPSACQVRLQKLAIFQSLPVLIGPGDCGADDAVELEAIVLPDQAKVAVTPPATLRCPMAEQVAQWIRDDVAPAMTGFGAALSGLDNFDSYECRGRNRVHAAALSEHGRADALDVRAFKLANGQAVALTDVNVDKAWRDGIRLSACARFSTVLGPGSDGNHEEHIHLDLAARRGDYKVCEWDVRVPPPPAEAQEPNGAAPAEAVPLEGLDAPAIPPGEVPLPRPRPRLAANAGNGPAPNSLRGRFDGDAKTRSQ